MRVFGLDIVRTVAILLVVCGHTLEHSKVPEWLRNINRLGGLGVELFFVLSGFLIGGIIVELIHSKRFETIKHLGRFWSRRWLRTLPLYYFFLIVYLRYDWRGPTSIRAHWEYLVFLQNFAWRCPDFFITTWSLTIEEYFYLLFPIAFYLLHRLLRDPMRCLRWSVMLFIAVPLLYKIRQSAASDWETFAMTLRMETVTRLDSLMYGVAMAIMKRQRPDLWQRLASWVVAPALAIAALGVYFYIGLPGLLESRALRCLLYPIISICFALVLPYFDSIRSQKRSLLRRAVTYTSQVSYSLYLGHPLIFTLVDPHLGGITVGGQRLAEMAAPLYAIYFVGFFLLATATYYAIELPFMKMRK